ncbi:hypothetical protein WJ977_01440 [Achromobacter xylosoxidans]
MAGPFLAVIGCAITIYLAIRSSATSRSRKAW